MCGKTATQSNLQDLLIYTSKRISNIITKNNFNFTNTSLANELVMSSLFMSITNANFDDEAIIKQIYKLFALNDINGLPIAYKYCMV